MPRTAAALLLIAAPLLAQHTDATPSCCSEATVTPLPPLPADATAKERWLRRIHEDAPDDASNLFLSSRYIDGLRARLDTVKPDAPRTERFGVRWTLAQALVRIGALDEAIALCRQCERICAEAPTETANWLPEVLLRLGATHFRQAEKQNCIARHNADSCILPLAGNAVHVEKAGAAAAAEVLTRLLALPGSDLGLEAKWLLNIAHQALGDWPDGVPEAHRIPAAVFTAEAPFPHMIDRGASIGLGHHHHAGSLAIDDFTGDGVPDLFVCSFDTGVAPRLLRSEGDGRFTNIAAPAGLQHQLGGANLVHGDIDNDGLRDVLVLRGGGFFAGSAFPLSLLRQDRPGHFVDVSAAAGVELAAPTRSAAFADIDRDGDLDLFVACESERTQDGVKFDSRLFRNDGKGHFTDITATSGITNPDRAVGAVFADFDGDGLPELFVSNFMAQNRLFHNRGDSTFAECAAARGIAEPVASGPCATLDFDNDGDLDLFVGWQHHYRQIRSVAAWYIDGRIEDDGHRLFENDGKGHFRDVAAERGLRRAQLATGINTGDVDNDGCQDLYITTGAHDLAALFPNVLLLGGERFRDATFAAGVGHLQKGNGVALADLDGDGDLEIGAQVGGFYPDDGFGSVLFENPGNGNHWLDVELRGVRDNRFGIGARVRAHVVGAAGERDIYVTVGAGGSLGCNPLGAHLGLGAAERIAFVEVRWLASGETQRVEGIPVDTRITITQGQAKAEPRRRTPFRLG